MRIDLSNYSHISDQFRQNVNNILEKRTTKVALATLAFSALTVVKFAALSYGYEGYLNRLPTFTYLSLAAHSIYILCRTRNASIESWYRTAVVSFSVFTSTTIAHQAYLLVKNSLALLACAQPLNLSGAISPLVDFAFMYVITLPSVKYLNSTRHSLLNSYLDKNFKTVESYFNIARDEGVLAAYIVFCLNTHAISSMFPKETFEEIIKGYIPVMPDFIFKQFLDSFDEKTISFAKVVEAMTPNQKPILDSYINDGLRERKSLEFIKGFIAKLESINVDNKYDGAITQLKDVIAKQNLIENPTQPNHTLLSKIDRVASSLVFAAVSSYQYFTIARSYPLIFGGAALMGLYKTIPSLGTTRESFTQNTVVGRIRLLFAANTVTSYSLWAGPVGSFINGLTFANFSKDLLVLRHR